MAVPGLAFLASMGRPKVGRRQPVTRARSARVINIAALFAAVLTHCSVVCIGFFVITEETLTCPTPTSPS